IFMGMTEIRDTIHEIRIKLLSSISFAKYYSLFTND
ncbi:unnamed protein product, partial [marine sediment metagenome]